jgi:MFS family permease
MKNLNDKRLFWASFLTLIAAGIGFSVRGVELLGAWRTEFGFTMTALGGITGGGLVGFGITIIVLSFVADRIGYGPLMVLAFLLHISSAAVTLAATPIYRAYGQDACWWCLYVGMFLFSLGNGTCEAVINPLTATLFPKEKTHWLNILHAGWPGGLMLGALIGIGFSFVGNLPWEVPFAVFLVPTLLYGGLMLGCTFPRSEAAASGVSYGTMLLTFVSPILLFLLLLHALVGYVELGTDSWITNITRKIMENKTLATLLFMWTSGLMFVLRFFAGPIVHKISPLGLLLGSAVLGTAGLLLLGMAPVGWAILGVAFCFFAATVYGLGKTFFWPTMLGVASERYPQGGALVLGMMGGVGMLSAGLLGGPGIGYKQDYFASNYLKDTKPETYARYKSDEVNAFLFFPKVSGLDGSKVAVLNDNGEQLQKDMDVLAKQGESLTRDDWKGLEAVAATRANDQPLTAADYRTLRRVAPKALANLDLKLLDAWWTAEGKPNVEDDKGPVNSAELVGGKTALLVTAAVPAMMALGYLLLIVYFSMTGGYKAIHLEEEPKVKVPEDVGGYVPPMKPADADAYTDGIPGEGVESTPL